METPYGHEERETLSPTCNFAFFDCLVSRNHAVDTASPSSRTGVERDMAALYQQPHLVPPMKLTVFDELPPPTPPPVGPSHVFSWMSHSKVSSPKEMMRNSLSIRRRVPPRPVISSPKAVITREPSKGRRDYRPLELSIYLPNNRLSDLPEFNRLSFTDIGEIKFPPRAVLRTQSEDNLHRYAPVEVAAPKPASMFERRMSHVRQNTCSSVVSTSRPPSEYDALHSHPVSWASLPGLPPQIAMVAEPKNSITILSPMQEEFTPPASSNVLNDIVMDFPAIETKQEIARQSVAVESEAAPSPKIAAVAPLRHQAVAPGAGVETNVARPYFHTNYQTQKRISQWLAHRSHSSSISTVKTTASTSTTSSFAEHRRKRSQFYMLSAGYVAPPKPLRLVGQHQHQHQRSMTASTVASTVDTDIMSVDEDDMESMTTAPTASEIQSRSGTIKSVNTGAGFLNTGALRPIVSGIPDLPGCYGEVVDAIESEKNEELCIIKEINGPLRSPMGHGGVGLAF